MNKTEHPLGAMPHYATGVDAAERKRRRMSYQFARWQALGLPACPVPRGGECPYYNEPERRCLALQAWRRREPKQKSVCAKALNLSRALAFLLEQKGIEPKPALLMACAVVGSGHADMRAQALNVLKGNVRSNGANGKKPPASATGATGRFRADDHDDDSAARVHRLLGDDADIPARRKDPRRRKEAVWHPGLDGDVGLPDATSQIDELFGNGDDDTTAAAWPPAGDNGDGG